jgi:hypothetical protein
MTTEQLMHHIVSEVKGMVYSLKIITECIGNDSDHVQSSQVSFFFFTKLLIFLLQILETVFNSAISSYMFDLLPANSFLSLARASTTMLKLLSPIVSCKNT